MRGGVFCLFFCCISALSAHYLFNKPCRGWRPWQPAFWTLHLVIYYTNFEKNAQIVVRTSIVRQFRYPTQLRNSSNPETPRNGTSRAPSPTFCSQVLLPQNRFARCCLLFHSWAQLWSAMPIPHSSFLTPHLTPHLNYAEFCAILKKTHYRG